MNRNDEIWLEGFTTAIACTGNTTGCTYNHGTESSNTWWDGFKTAKNLDTRDAVQKQLLKFRKAA